MIAAHCVRRIEHEVQHYLPELDGVSTHHGQAGRKLGADGERYVVNVWGVGYRLMDPVGPALEQVA